MGARDARLLDVTLIESCARHAAAGRAVSAGIRALGLEVFGGRLIGVDVGFASLDPTQLASIAPMPISAPKWRGSRRSTSATSRIDWRGRSCA